MNKVRSYTKQAEITRVYILCLWVVYVTTRRMYDVIVVGAGISGLHAANCLVEEGLDVLVLEARDRVGGRTCTQHDSKFDYAEMGGAYFGRHQTRVISLAESLGLQLYKLPSDGMSTIHLEGQSYPYREDGIPPLSISTLLDWNNILLKMDQMSRKVPMAAPWDAPEAALWDSMSVEDFINKTCWTGFVRKVMLTGLSVVYGHFCEDISLLYCLQTIRVSGGIRALFGSINGLQESKLIGGSAAISNRLAERLKGRVQLCCPVQQIQQTEDHVTVVTDNGASRQAKRLVVACSPHVVSKLNFEPALPTRLSQLLQFDPKTDDIIKTVMYYEDAFWRRKGLRGEVIGDRDQPVLYAIDDTKHDGQHPAIMGKATIANYYAKAFGIEALARPVHYVERSWSDEDCQMFSGPCVFTCPPGYLTKHNRFWGEKFQLVHFAGTETSVVFRGYMDGAVRAAERVTQEVLDSLGKTSRRVYKADLEEIPYIPVGTVDRLLPSIPTVIGAATIVLPLLGVVAYKLWE